MPSKPKYDLSYASIFQSVVPRHLQLTIARSGGTIGQVQLNFTIVYVTNGTIYKDALEMGSRGSVLFEEKEKEKVLKLNIKASTFLNVGAYFQATLDAVNLANKGMLTDYFFTGCQPSLGK
jgi:hypothetical protein